MNKYLILTTSMWISCALAALDPIAQRYEDILTLKMQSRARSNDLVPQTASMEIDSDYGTLRLSPQQQFVGAVNAMRTHDRPQTLNQEADFSVNAWQSLRLFNEEPSLVQAIAPDIATVFGRVFLTRLMTSPCVDSQKIEHRQQLIKAFVNNDELRQRVRTLCAEVAKMQEHLIALQSAQHPLYDKSLQVYFHKRLMRGVASQSTAWNVINKIFDDVWFAAFIIVYGLPLWGPMAFAWGESFLSKNDEASIGNAMSPRNDDKHDTTIKHLCEKSPAKSTQTKSSDDLFLRSVKALMNKIPLGDDHADPFNKARLQLLLVGLLTYVAYHGYGIVKWIWERWRVLNYFYHNLQPLKNYFAALKKLQLALFEIRSMAKLADEIDFSIITANPHHAKLQNLLAQPAFNHKTNAHVLGGIIVLALDELMKSRESLLKGVGLIGALDVYSSLAEWYLSAKQPNAKPVCFASLIHNAQTPQLITKDFWHPIYNHQNVSVNSLTLGAAGEPRSAVITGIFESGKSTLLTALASTVVCAQTIGLCPAKAVSLTPFSVINVYAGIKDDLANNRSLFATEIYRSDELVEQAAALASDQFCFTIIDCAFTGTEDKEGQSAAFSVANYLGHLKNSISVHATNFLSLGRLGIEQPDLFTNYYLPSHFDEKTSHTYTLMPGVETPILATAIFREEGIPEHMITELEKELTSSLTRGGKR